ncbi:MAG TPA: hypothetical protein VH079_12495 [Terriglobales bacterium]|nr:hypothetical protein [Terriglobales bacterium]
MNGFWSRALNLGMVAACMATASLLALSGCTSVKVKLGMKVYLAKIPVASIAATLPKGPGIAPGEKSALVVVVTEPDGKVLQTEGKGKGKVMWKDLSITTTVVTANKKGILSFPHDPRKTDGKLGHITITIPSHPDIKTELDIPVRYNFNFVSNFSGSNGNNGSDGIAGSDGMSGSPGSTDPNNPSAGGDGSSGGNGTDGSNGGNGGDAPPVQIRMTLRAGSHPLLQVGVTAAGHQKLYLVDPQGGSLTVRADGGQGGSGGKGGRGGRGGSGGSGTPSGNSGSDGSSGQDGSNGSNGRGGAITVTYDPQAKPYLAVLRLSNVGGPKPVLNEEAVAPLW